MYFAKTLKSSCPCSNLNTSFSRLSAHLVLRPFFNSFPSSFSGVSTPVRFLHGEAKSRLQSECLPVNYLWKHPMRQRFWGSMVATEGGKVWDWSKVQTQVCHRLVVHFRGWITFVTILSTMLMISTSRNNVYMGIQNGLPCQMQKMKHSWTYLLWKIAHFSEAYLLWILQPLCALCQLDHRFQRNNLKKTLCTNFEQFQHQQNFRILQIPNYLLWIPRGPWYHSTNKSLKACFLSPPLPHLEWLGCDWCAIEQTAPADNCCWYKHNKHKTKSRMLNFWQTPRPCHWCKKNSQKNSNSSPPLNGPKKFQSTQKIGGRSVRVQKEHKSLAMSEYWSIYLCFDSFSFLLIFLNIQPLILTSEIIINREWINEILSHINSLLYIYCPRIVAVDKELIASHGIQSWRNLLTAILLLNIIQNCQICALNCNGELDSLL